MSQFRTRLGPGPRSGTRLAWWWRPETTTRTEKEEEGQDEGREDNNMRRRGHQAADCRPSRWEEGDKYQTHVYSSWLGPLSSSDFKVITEDLTVTFLYL